jgi:ATP-dependent Zn protease
MEAFKTRLKTIAWFLTALMLFQSCVVYHKTPTTLEKASQEQIKTKVTNNEGETIKFKYITYEDGVYYGVNKKSGELIKTPLDKQYVETVLLKNKSASTWVTVLVIAVPIIGIVIIALADLSSGYNVGFY